MNSQNTLENTLNEILLVIKPLPKDWEARVRVLRELEGAIESEEGLRGATVEPFGSFVSNLYTCWGDLDISIEFSRGSYILSYGKKYKQQLLGLVMGAMRQRGGWKRIHFIPQARVPILKVQSYIQNISCDISINNLSGQMKSKLLFCIGEIDERFRYLVLLVKEMAKAHGINNPKFGSFNSYALSLLVVFHFQTCEPAILPPLKDIYPGNLTVDLQGLRADAEKRIEESCVANIERFKSNNLGAKNTSSLSQLFFSFLEKFSDLNLKAKKYGICPYTGQWEDIGSNMTWLPHTYNIMVEDPFDQPENSSRGVSMEELLRISSTFYMIRHILMSANQSHVLATIVRPLTSRFVVGISKYRLEHHNSPHLQRLMTENLNSRAPRENNVPWQPYRSQAYKGVHQSSQMPPQLNNVKPRNHLNKPTLQPEHRPRRYTDDNSSLRTYQDCVCGMCTPQQHIQ